MDFLSRVTLSVAVFKVSRDTFFISHENAYFLFSVLRVVQGEANHQK